MNQPDRPRWQQVGRRLLSLLAPLLALVAVTGFFAVVDRLWADGTFATTLNLRTVTIQTCVVAVAALGMSLIIISGGIDLSAGTALALCATTLAWGLREDAAHLLRHGDNFARASIRLEEAQKRLKSARQESPERQAELQRQVQLTRSRLIELLTAKRGALAASSVTAGGKDPRTVLDQKLARLQADEFTLRVDPLWLEGIPNSPWTPWVALLIGISTGGLAGLFNGVLISTLRIPPFVVTLGSMTMFLGLGNLLSGNVPIRPSFSQIPSWIGDLDGNTPEALWGGFPTGVWLAGLLAVVVGLALRYTVFGRYVFALGSNEHTARLCGIHVGWTKTSIYALGGLLFGIAGVYQFARLSTGNPMSGAGLELEVIAAVVIGGGSLSGGRGTVLGTLAGAAMTAVIKSGCTQLELSDALQRIILGVIIICAVTIDQLRQRHAAAGS
ncbi:MAG: hypothetical protein U0935_13900 [Pirellulales bacterium]